MDTRTGDVMLLEALKARMTQEEFEQYAQEIDPAPVRFWVSKSKTSRIPTLSLGFGLRNLKPTAFLAFLKMPAKGGAFSRS